MLIFMLFFFFVFASFHEQRFHYCHTYLMKMGYYFIDIPYKINASNIRILMVYIDYGSKISAIVKMINFQSSPSVALYVVESW